VADEAVDQFLTWHASTAALDANVADQVVPFLALARSPSTFTCPKASPHLRTVGWVVERFRVARVVVDGARPVRVEVTPAPEPDSA
jgi:RNA 3'-terminal phosphate cyclase